MHGSFFYILILTRKLYFLNTEAPIIVNSLFIMITSQSILFGYSFDFVSDESFVFLGVFSSEGCAVVVGDAPSAAGSTVSSS